MGMTAVYSSSSGLGESVSLLTTPGVRIGGIFITAALVYLLAYLNVLEASEHNRRRLRTLLVIAIFPLATVFIAIVTIETLAVIGGP